MPRWPWQKVQAAPQLVVMCGGTVVGRVLEIEGDQPWMNGRFARADGYEEHAALLDAVAELVAAEDDDALERLEPIVTRLAELDFKLCTSDRGERLDEEGSLSIADDTVMFRPTAAFRKLSRA